MWALRQSTGVHSAVHAIITIASLCKRMKSLPILPLSKNIALFFDLERLSSLTLLSQFLRRVKKKDWRRFRQPGEHTVDLANLANWEDKNKQKSCAYLQKNKITAVLSALLLLGFSPKHKLRISRIPALKEGMSTLKEQRKAFPLWGTQEMPFQGRSKVFLCVQYTGIWLSMTSNRQI